MHSHHSNEPEPIKDGEGGGLTDPPLLFTKSGQKGGGQLGLFILIVIFENLSCSV